jgi:hypothetical protein
LLQLIAESACSNAPGRSGRSRPSPEGGLLTHPIGEERLRGSSAKPTRRRPHARSFLDCLRALLTPDTGKQAHRGRHAKKPSPRWATPPLILTLLVMTGCGGASPAERFETAKGFVAACLPKRRRPGPTVHGSPTALAQRPRAARRAGAAGGRRRRAALLELPTEGFLVLGGEGSRRECPRTAELERRRGCGGKAPSAPTRWVTALVHRRTGLRGPGGWARGTRRSGNTCGTG